ncbi:uncharacterized protein MCYG_04753 [Microsporum canis CBS 113480]|uniref:Uncharacterized protein n=1 Tax=Arthroderma otae (strain ATCC MYA-4605 / CBS 113480) TaxID=554155 RepID=C5FPY1_ARTOC|nr:uncharacterized protein MCYG_04753 [Microsporum canis CBS 113480]EEQ31934.1 predicted protein [Microsporum canis CBS 113480]
MELLTLCVLEAVTTIITAYFPTLASPLIPDLKHENECFFTQASPIPKNEIMIWLAGDEGLKADLFVIGMYFAREGLSSYSRTAFFLCLNVETCWNIWRTRTVHHYAYAELPQSKTDCVSRVKACVWKIQWRVAQNLVIYPLDGCCYYSLVTLDNSSESSLLDFSCEAEWAIYYDKTLTYSGPRQTWCYNKAMPDSHRISASLSVLLLSSVIQCPAKTTMLSEMSYYGAKLHIGSLLTKYGTSRTSNIPRTTKKEDDLLRFGCDLAPAIISTSHLDNVSRRLRRMKEVIYKEPGMPRLDRYMSPLFNNNQGKYLVELILQNICGMDICQI